MKILLTGASGFIGSSVLPLLAGTGDEVTILTRPVSVRALQQYLDSRGFSCTILAAEPVEWAHAIGNRSFDLCLHLAWIAVPGIYLTSPENETFADCTLALAERLFANGTPHFIGTGSGIEYAPGQTAACHEETTPACPPSPYGLAKLRTQQGLAQLAGRLGTSWTWARIFYPYGLGEHPARTASTFLRTLAAGQPLHLRTGGSIKDFIEISDLASALLHLTKAPPQHLINLGTGLPFSIMEAALLAAAITGADPDLVHNTGDGVDPYSYHIASSQKLRLTGWQPSVTPEAGFSRLWNSFSSSQS